MIWKTLNLVVAILYLPIGGYIIFRFKDKLPYKTTVVVLTLLIFICQIIVLIEAYNIGLELELEDPAWWSFKNALPTANISPFMFIMVFVALFLPENIQKHFYLLMALLSFAMIFAGIIEPIIYLIEPFSRYYLLYSFGWINHFMMVLFSIYLLLTKKIELTVRNCVKASMIIYVTVAVMMVLNIIFGTSFFGLAFNGRHNIYTRIVIPNPYLSALVYIIGLTFFLIIGYWFLKFIKRIDEKRTVVVDE